MADKGNSTLTTIVTDGLIVASDTQGDCGGVKEPGHHNKVIEYQNKVFALCGAIGFLEPLAKWYCDGRNPETMPRGDKDNRSLNFAFWAFDDGKLWEFNYTMPYRVENYAPAFLGSGREIAIGAFDCNPSPAEAVRKAMRWDVYTGGEVRILELPKHLQIAHGEPSMVEQAPKNGTLPDWVVND